MVSFFGSLKNCSSCALYKLKLFDSLYKKACEKTITVVNPAGYKSMNTFLWIMFWHKASVWLDFWDSKRWFRLQSIRTSRLITMSFTLSPFVLRWVSILSLSSFFRNKIISVLSLFSWRKFYNMQPFILSMHWQREPRGPESFGERTK